MRKKSIFFLIIGCVFSFTIKAQKLNGEAKIFEPGVISLEETWDEYLSFSPDGKWLSFTREGDQLSHYNRRIYLSQYNKGKWSKPLLAPFSGDFHDRSSSFSPDGKTLYFASNRPGKRGFDNDYDLWMSTMDKQGKWSTPKRLDDAINSDEYNEVHPYVAKSGNLYFVRYKRGVETDIYVSKWSNGKYHEPERLGTSINDNGPDSHCYIDPDERFLIFAATDRVSGEGAGDIYISYLENGVWTPAVNMGTKINTKLYEYSAQVGPDNRLYFSRASFDRKNPMKSDIYFIEVASLIKKSE